MYTLHIEFSEWKGGCLVKERPISFNGDMVRAVLDGSKTQTRRIIKPQPEPQGSCAYGGGSFDWCEIADIDRLVHPRPEETWHRQWCTYGIPGDRLWVRETWGVHRITGTAGGNSYYEYPNVLYRADCSTRLVIGDEVWGYVEESFRWRPSIHMPRWASRITLEVTDVRVEQDSGQWLWVVEFRVSDKRRTTMTSKRSCGAS